MARLAARRKDQFVIASPKAVAVADAHPPVKMEQNEVFLFDVSNTCLGFGGYVQNKVADCVFDCGGPLGVVKQFILFLARSNSYSRQESDDDCGGPAKSVHELRLLRHSDARR
jgi:hypothetical protein